MMKIYVALIMFMLVVFNSIKAETLFEVKDASNQKVLDVSSDGLRVLNNGDTLMVISPYGVRVNLDNSANKALSRTFAVTTTSSKNKGLNRVLEVGTESTTMREGGAGERYVDFSPLNLFLGLNSGRNTVPNPNPFNPGDQTTWEGKFNIFVGNESGRDNTTGYFNLFIGDKAGQMNNGGQKNTFVGSQSGQANVSGGYNSHFGYNSGITSTGTSNVFVGANCGFNNAEKSYNTYNGTAAGEYFKGSYNTFIGYCAGRNSPTLRTGDGNVFIGSNAGSLSGSISNKLYIANTSTNIPLIYGDFSTNNVGLGTNAPGSNRLRVVSSTEVTNIAGATGYFENSYSGGIGLAALATSTDVALYVEQKNSTSTTANIAKFASLYGGWSEKMTLRSTGRLYTPYLATGTGTALYLTTGGEVVKYSSSRKFKKDIVPLSVDIDKFMSLQPVSFKWNEKSSSENKEDTGLIAEDVEKIDPVLAVYNDKGEVEGVDYQGVNIMLLKVVQQQQKDIEYLKKELESLKQNK